MAYAHRAKVPRECGKCACKAPLSELITRGASEKDVPRLAKELGSNPDSMERVRAAMLLGSMGEKEGVDALAEAMRTDRDWAVKRFCAEALGKIGGVRAEKALVEALKDKDPRVRLEAADSLQRMDAFAAIADIERLVADPVGYVARNAAKVVAQMKIDALDPHKAARRALRHAGQRDMHGQLMPQG